MPALPFVLVAICVMTIGYRYYSAFIAARVLSLDGAAITPAHRLEDGVTVCEGCHAEIDEYYVRSSC